MARTRRAAAAQEAAEAGKQKTEATAAATRAVLETAELLEMILLHLPLNELLVAQRVSTYWKDNVLQSKKIQQALYLRPFSDNLLQSVQTSYRPWGPGRWMYKNNAGREVVVRPVLNPVMPRYFFDYVDQYRSILHIGFVNPIFNREAYAFADRITDMPNSKDLGPRSVRQLHRFHSSQASWKDMLLMQPPCSEIKIMCGKFLQDPRGGRIMFTITNPRGVTLQDLRKGLCNHWTDCPLDPLRRTVERWDFEGDTLRDIQLLKSIPSSAELLDCLERPETDSLPEISDDFRDSDSSDEE